MAVLLTIGALVQVAADADGAYRDIALFAAVAGTTAVAWRRRAPASAAAVAASALLVYQLASSDRQMTFEPYAVLLTYYSLGRYDGKGHRRIARGALLAYALTVLVFAFAHLGQRSVGNVGSAWLLFAVAPCVGGVLIARRAALTAELATRTRALTGQEQIRLEAIAAQERIRIARDLHDVITHCVTVMVIQAGASRLLARRDPATARESLQVVAESGREAMADLRRTVGAVRRGTKPAAGQTTGLRRLVDLVERTRATGVPTQLRVTGPRVPLSADLDLTLHRIAQEALTNAVKHAGPCRVWITVTFDRDAVVLQIANDGNGDRSSREGVTRTGHGLVGMRERVAQYGGRFHAAGRPDGGFVVTARLPVGTSAGPQEPTVLDRPRPSAARRRRSARWWAEIAIAGSWLAALETDALTSSHRKGPLALNVAAVAVAALAILWRRNHPWRFQVVVAFALLLLSSGLTSRNYGTLVGVYGVLLPSYAVAAWSSRSRATFAMALWATGAVIAGAVQHANLGGTVGPLVLATVAFAAGLIMRSQRELATALGDAARRLEVERDDRESLAVAGERTRIVHDLDGLVAHGVTEMIIQAEVALSLLHPAAGAAPDPDATSTAIAAVEDIGRDVLAQLRRVLGVLRHGDPGESRRPQPGLGDIHALVEQSRQDGQPVDLAIEGDPGTLLAGVDLVTYRIVQEVLADTPHPAVGRVVISLRFGASSLELEVRAPSTRGRSWPSRATEDRVALLNGRIDIGPAEDQTSRLLVTLPRPVEVAFA